MVDLDSNPTKLIEIVAIGKQLLMTRGALTTFSISNDVAKYFAIIPAMFAGVFPVLNALNIMHLHNAESAVLSAVIFNALDHRRAHPARPARRQLQAHVRGRPAAAQPAGLWPRRHHRAVHRHQGSSTSSLPPCIWPEQPKSRGPNMKKHIITAILYTAVTTILLGIVYPLAVTGIAHLTMRSKADGQLIIRNGELIGSALIGQPFTGPTYFHSRPSAAGTGYDATLPQDRNLGPDQQGAPRSRLRLCQDRVNRRDVPVDLVTASASGLDPDITPAAALYQVARVARERQLDQQQVQQLVTRSILPRQFGLLGEPRVNVLNLNLALDSLEPEQGSKSHTPKS